LLFTPVVTVTRYFLEAPSLEPGVTVTVLVATSWLTVWATLVHFFVVPL
jgi:hypothetical protein